MRPRPIALVAMAFAMACHDTPQPTEPNLAPSDPSKIISDGAHGGNKDFWWLPPMVPLPIGNPDFKIGTFNNTLRSSIRIDICQLKSENLNAQGLPTANTGCGPLVKQFAVGSVNLVNLPLKQNGWWTQFNLPPDGFYYVLWDTRQSNLDVNKYYRIKVFVDGTTDPLGVADVDPMANIFQWKYTLTGQVIQLVDDVMLPIAFRVEQGALCPSGRCNSSTYDNTSTTPLTITLDPDKIGSVAGVTIPAGALPSVATDPTCTPTTCPQNVVVTVTEVPTGPGTETVCHPALANYIQFRGCFNFTTTPALRRINENGDQFIKDVLVAVCYELQGTGDAREKFAELYSSAPNEPPHALRDAPEGSLLGANTKKCPPPPVTFTNTNPVVQVASRGWSAIKAGLGKVFGVKTAYAVDLGLGGLTAAFSNISPVLPVTIQPASFVDITLPVGQYTAIVSTEIVGNHLHDPNSDGAGDTGVNGVPVTFSVAGNNGTLDVVGSPGVGTTSPLTVNSAATGGEISTDGIAAAKWTVPTTPGTYVMSASGPADGGPIIYTVTVPPPFEAWSGAAVNLATNVVTFGGAPYCVYTVQFSNVNTSLNLDATGGGNGGLTGVMTEQLATPPCGDIQPFGTHADNYTSSGVTRVGNNVTATFTPVGNPISANINFTGVMSDDQQTVVGTFTFHRIDQGPPLDWTVSLPATLTRTPPPNSLTPNLIFSGSEAYTANGSNWVRYRLGVTNYRVYPVDMFAPRPDLPPCGLNTNASRTWVDIYDASNNARIYGFCALRAPSDLNLIWFAKPAGTAPPAQVYIKLTDRAQNVTYTSNSVTIAQ